MSEPGGYTHGHHESVLRSHRWRTAQNSAAYLTPWLRPGLDLLDVGCGPGNLTIDLARLVAPGPTLGVDASASVIDAARADLDDDLPVSFEVGDAYALSMPDDSFDLVHAHQVLQHLTDPVAALIEWRRVCRPGGIVACRDSDYAAMTWYPAEPALDEWLCLYRLAAHENGAEPDAGRRLLAWAHAAGFAEVTATASVWCFATPTDTAWWADLWADRFTSSAVARQLVDGGHANDADLASIAAAWRAWAEHPDAWFMVPHGEILARA